MHDEPIPLPVVLVAHPDCREAHKIFMALRGEAFAPVVALTDQEAKAAIRESKPALMVALAGLNLIAVVRARWPRIRCIALTDSHSRPYGPDVPCLCADPLPLRELFNLCHDLLRPKVATPPAVEPLSRFNDGPEISKINEILCRRSLSERQVGMLLGAKQALAWARFPKMFCAPHEIVLHPRARELKFN